MNLARKRLTRKLLALFTVPVVLCFVAGGVAAFWTSRETLLGGADRALADQLATLRIAVEPLAALGRDGDLGGLVERVAAEETVHGCSLYDERGAPLARSSLLAADPAVADAAAARAVATAEAVHDVLRIGDREVLVRAEPVRGVRGLGAALMTHELGPVDRMIELTLLRLALTGGVVVLVVSALAFWLSRALGRGLGDLVHGAERIAAGDLGTRVRASHLLELDRVARAFNEMSGSLAEAREKLLSAEASRHDLAARMRHAQALTVVGQVAGSFAHEIGSPLNTILGWSRLSAADDAIPEGVRRQFETISAQCERITRIVQRMLAVARPPSDLVQPVHLGEVVREVTAFLAPDLRARRVDLRVDVAEGLPPVTAVRDQVMQVVMNLCVNAIQAQSGSGTLRISLAAEVEDARPKTLCLEVADAGPGVPEELRGQIFEPFYTTKRASGGTGLGLPIVTDIVRELGGKVEVRDAPEGGALFRVILPVT
ncbi:sensor histidine kinase [Polyangium aurulentum]|uniref:sensor histidine kinase n=1 Tax=Polyangium aurulentum TaxID=2567896 RepID=UPI0010AEEA2D|nr:sensor histidine kinase [Polyangium aurulentum]UQA57765.1 HAMP domain-containing protein [Polyangium aurulentum]